MLIDPVTENIIDANPFLLEMIGFPLGDIAGKKLWEIGAIKDIETTKALFKTLQETGYSHYEDLPLQSKDGKEHEVEFVSNKYRIDGTEMIQCNIRDVTERKIVEKKAKAHLDDLERTRAILAEAQAKEHAILASIGEGIIAIDKRGIIIAMNRKAEILLGYESGDLLGKNVYDVIPVEDAEGHILPPEKRPVRVDSSEDENVAHTTYFYQRKDGTKIPVAINGVPIILDTNIIGFVSVFRDVTKEQQLEKAKDEFISLAVHQLKTPITAISWNTEMLLGGDYGAPNEKQKEVLESIGGSSKDMLELVSGFLEATKMESSGFAIEKGDVDLLSISDSILAELADQILGKKLNIIKSYGTDVSRLDIGTKAARIILQNLITNAIKYTPENGTVEIKIEKAAEGVSISVKDNGCGIPEDAKSRIFTKLFRADNVKEKEPSGTGLGLYLLKSLVDKLGGKVWFESVEGAGTTFYINLK